MNKMKKNMAVLCAMCATVLITGVSYAADKATDKSVPPSPAKGSEVDNSKMNEHPANQEKTAESQSNSKGDVEITRQIRQAIVKDESLSTNAHNVKIITNNGSVVLKGPVNSDTEKSKVEALAKKVAGVQKVENQVNVKTN